MIVRLPLPDPDNCDGLCLVKAEPWSPDGGRHPYFRSHFGIFGPLAGSKSPAPTSVEDLKNTSDPLVVKGSFSLVFSLN